MRPTKKSSKGIFFGFDSQLIMNYRKQQNFIHTNVV
jgi:hypothetical protein